MHPNTTAASTPRRTNPTVFDQLFPAVDSEAKQTIRQILAALNPPVDMPMAIQLITTCARQIDCYFTSLDDPTGQMEDLHDRVMLAAAAVQRQYDGRDMHEHPLMRRLVSHAAWGLAIDLTLADHDRPEGLAFGMQLALSIAKKKPFPHGFATDLRISLSALNPKGGRTDGDASYPWQATLLRAAASAARLFETSGESSLGTLDSVTHQERVRRELVRTMRFAMAKHRQGVPEPKGLHPAEARSLANEIRILSEKRDDTMAVSAVSVCTGTSYVATLDVPIGAPTDQVITIDAARGVVITNMGTVTPDAAKALEGIEARPASRFIEKPLPQWLATILRQAVEKKGAQVVRDAFPEAASEAPRFVDPETGKLSRRISLPRLMRSRTQLSLSTGIDRLATACLLNDFSVIPASKLYYCWLSHEDIWSSSATLFEALGWGEPVPKSAGSNFGSRIIPSDAAISRWFLAQRKNILNLWPGRNCKLDRLIAHHNAYALLCASLAVLLFALRETKAVSLTAAILTATTRTVNIYDKRVGWFPRPLPVPVCDLMRDQIRLWRAHCATLLNRLGSLGLRDTPLQRALNAVIARADVPIFFTATRSCGTETISSASLLKCWPDEQKFSTDFGRHYWEATLRDNSCSSRAADLLLRHTISGLEHWTGTGQRAGADYLDEIGRIQDQKLVEIGFTATPGLSRRGAEL